MARQFLSSDDAVPADGQHRQPCSDCPWARTALPGWIGRTPIEGWIRAVHGEAKIDCHTRTGAQCAGAAIYRANICKLPRDPRLLRLEKNRDLVFATPDEFRTHHQTGTRTNGL